MGLDMSIRVRRVPRRRWSERGFLVGLAVFAAIVGVATAAAAGDPRVLLKPYLVGIAGLVVFFIVVFTRPSDMVPWLIASTVFQGVLVLDVGFYVLPAYVLSAVALFRLWMAREGAPSSPMNRPVRLFLLLATLSVPVAFYEMTRLPRIELGIRFSEFRPLIQLVVLVLLASCYYVVLMSISSRAAYRRALRVLIVVAWLVSGYALYQQVAYRVGLPTLDFLNFNSASAFKFTSSGSALLLRPNSTFPEPLDLGRFLVATLSLTLPLVMVRDQRFLRTFWLRAVLVAQLLALVGTLSGGALAGFLIASIFLIVFSRMRVRLALSVVLLVAVVLASGQLLRSTVLGGGVPATQLFTERAAGTLAIELAPASGNPNVGSRRMDYWAASLEMLARYPLTGVGIGNFGAGAVALNPALHLNAGSYGVFWGMIGEFGVVGLLLYLYFVWMFASSSLRAYRRFGHTNPELVGFFAGFVGVMVQYLSSGYGRMDVFVWAFIGLGMVACRLSEVERQRGERRPAHVYGPGDDSPHA